MKKYTTNEALLKPLSKQLIQEAVKRFESDYYSKTFKTEDHLRAIIYAQLHDVKSLRDLEIAFNNQKLLGPFQGKKVSRSTLSDANKQRPSDCFFWIAKQLMSLLPRKKRKEIDKVVRKLDSSPIQLKGKGYDEWTKAKCTLRCQGLKLHVEYDGELAMPVEFQISAANIDDCSEGQKWSILPDTIYVFDKGYYDYNWWWSIDQKGAFFVTRLKSNAGIEQTKVLEVIDEKIEEDGMFLFKHKNPRRSKKNRYQTALRRVVVKREGKSPLVLITNLLEVPAALIAELYKERWGIELFFKWIKQNLRIKKFLGKSENAVKAQIAIALIVYLLIGLFRNATNPKLSLHQLLVWIKHNWVAEEKIYGLLKPPNYNFPKQYLNLTGSVVYL